MSTEVERIYLELVSIKAAVEKNGSPSDNVAFEATASKSMLLATASYFEKAVCELIKNHAKEIWDSLALVSFLDKQALERKFHSLFDWNAPNINKFLKLFGKEFFDFIKPLMEEDGTKTAVREFIFLCRLRNELVHNNFAEFPIEFTSEDFKIKFDTAIPLMKLLAETLTKFESNYQKEDTSPG